MKVLAAVVTHNRKELLARCISAINHQSKLPAELLIINNASTDGTEDYLTSNNIHHITQDNLGSAGGWHRSIAYAQDNCFDAVWLMDDDGFPDTQALENLLKHTKQEFACLSSCVVDEKNHNRFVFPMPILNKYGTPSLRLFGRKIRHRDSKVFHGLSYYPFAHLFNGALISMNAINSIGNVNTDYFMMGDEVDYFYRLKTAGAVNTILDALHFHPSVESRPYSDTKIYYLLKNTIILHNTYFENSLLRNIGLIVSLFYRVIKRNGLRDAVSFIFKRKGNFYNAISRGLKGIIAKDM